MLLRRVALAALLVVVAACSSDGGPSVEEGGLPVYSLGAPDDVDTLPVAQALFDVLDLPEEAAPVRRRSQEARIDGAGHTGIVQDRGAGPVSVAYSGPLQNNLGCPDCAPLDESDDPEVLIERSQEIVEAIGVDASLIEWSSRDFNTERILVQGFAVIEGAVIDDLNFDFIWGHDEELIRFVGSLFTVETIGTVEGVGEEVARVQAESMLGSGREIVEFEAVYTGGFRDGELIVAPAYVATTDLGTTFSVSAFDGPLPG